MWDGLIFSWQQLCHCGALTPVLSSKPQLQSCSGKIGNIVDRSSWLILEMSIWPKKGGWGSDCYVKVFLVFLFVFLFFPNSPVLQLARESLPLSAMPCWCSSVLWTLILLSALPYFAQNWIQIAKDNQNRESICVLKNVWTSDKSWEPGFFF